MRLSIEWYVQIWFFIKGSGTSFPNKLYVWFFNIHISYEKILLSGCHYFRRYWTICVIVYCPVCDIINFEIIEKKSGQKFKYLKNETSFNHEIKNIFHHFWSDFIEVYKSNFFGRWESDFKDKIMYLIPPKFQILKMYFHLLMTAFQYWTFLWTYVFILWNHAFHQENPKKNWVY